MNEMDQTHLVELLSAYLDGELDRDNRERVESMLRDDASARRLLEELRQTVDLVSQLPRRPAPIAIADELQLQLEREELIGPAPKQPTVLRGRWSTIRNVFSLAAVLAVVVGVGSYLIQERNPRSPVPASERIASTPQNDEMREMTDAGRRETTRLRRRSAAGRSVDTSTNQARRVDVDAARPSEKYAFRPDGDDRLETSQDNPADKSRADAARLNSSAALIQTDAVALAAPTPTDEPGDGKAVVLAVAVRSAGDRDRLLASLSQRSEWKPKRDAVATRNTGDGRRQHEGDLKDARSARWRRRATSDDSSRGTTESGSVTLLVPVRSLSGVLSQVDAEVKAAEFTLEAGPLTVRGRERVQDMANVLAESSADSRNGHSASGPPKAKVKKESGWTALLDLLGIDEQIVSSLTSRPAEHSAGSRAQTAAKPESTSDSEPSPLVDGEGETSVKAKAQSVARESISERVDAGQMSVRQAGEESDADSDLTKEKPGLVGRVLRELETDDDTPEATRTKQREENKTDVPEPGERGMANLPVALTDARDADAAESQDVRSEAMRGAPTEELITLIVRIKVDPTIGDAPTAGEDNGGRDSPDGRSSGKAGTEVPADASSDESPKKPSKSKPSRPATKPTNSKPNRTTPANRPSSLDEPDSSSFKS